MKRYVLFCKVLFSLSVVLFFVVTVHTQDDDEEGGEFGQVGQTPTDEGESVGGGAEPDPPAGGGAGDDSKDGGGGSVGNGDDGSKEGSELTNEQNKLIEQLENDDSPKDLTEMAAIVLRSAWNINLKGVNQTSGNPLMDIVDSVGGEERLYFLRLLELIDKNMDGTITRDELVATYSGPMASPDQALDLMFRVRDFDGNGYISTYETLTQLLTIDGINFDVLDKWKESIALNKEMDANNDGLINMHEFMVYMLWQMNLGIAQSKVTATETPNQVD